jgi:hypothetical protein
MAHSGAILGNMSAKDIIHNGKHEEVMYRGRGILIKSMIAMILKNVKDMIKEGYSPTSVSLVWDQRKNGKYHKSDIIDALETNEGYKGDRSYLTQEDIIALDKKIEICEDPKELSELVNSRNDVAKSVIINEERKHARDFLREHLPKFGIPSFSWQGYEADDLDAIFAEETEKLGGYQIHYSGDSDWSFNLREKDVFWQVNRSKLYLKDANKIREKFGIPEGMSLMEWAELNYSARGSHNFLRRTIDPNIKRLTKAIMAKIYDKDFSDISDLDRFEAQRKCFRLGDFPEIDKVRDLHKQILPFKVSGSLNEFKDMLDDLKMGDDQKFFMARNYEEFTSSIRKSLMDQF